MRAGTVAVTVIICRNREREKRSMTYAQQLLERTQGTITSPRCGTGRGDYDLSLIHI